MYFNYFNMKNTIIKYIILIFCLIISHNIFAYSDHTLSYKVNDAYAQGEYNAAANLYKEIIDNGKASPFLYYNLGNSYYKLGNKGLAILNYEKALKLDPSYNDAIINKEIASLGTLDKIDVVPEFILRTLIKNIRNTITSNSWAILALVFLFITAFLMIGFRYASSSKLRKTSFILGCVVFLLFIFSTLFSWSLEKRALSDDYAIITVPVSNIKSAPNATGNNLFILHEGTKVELLEVVAGWSKIELSDGRQGWIQQNDISII